MPKKSTVRVKNNPFTLLCRQIYWELVFIEANIIAQYQNKYVIAALQAELYGYHDKFTEGLRLADTWEKTAVTKWFTYDCERLINICQNALELPDLC